MAEAFGFTTLDTSYLLGVYIPVLSEMTRTKLSDAELERGETVPGADKPISDPTKALLIRLLSRYHEYCPIKPSTTPHQVYEAIQKTPGYEDYKARHFGPLVGCELSSAYRWFSGSGITPTIGRYLSVVMSMMENLDDKDRQKMVAEIISLAEVEAVNRDVPKDYLWEHGSWKSPAKKKKSAKKKAAAKAAEKAAEKEKPATKAESAPEKRPVAKGNRKTAT
jgi:hypothetical protein